MKIRMIIGTLMMALVSWTCEHARKGSQGDATPTETKGIATPDTLVIALDWTPNVLHSGIFWALDHAYYKRAGLCIEWFTPEVDQYTKKPIQRLLDREVDLSVGPSEHLFFFAEEYEKSPVHAIATLLQRGRSCFVVKSSTGIDRPGQLDGSTYLGYHTPFENEVLSTMIIHDGGAGNFESVHPQRLEVWDAFMSDQGTVAWVFYHWEAALAARAGTDLNHFFPADHGVPYGYSSVLMARKDISKNRQDVIARFLRVTGTAYREVAEAPVDQVVSTLQRTVDHPNFEDSAFLAIAVQRIQGEFHNDDDQWGAMDESRWTDFLDWLNGSAEIDVGYAAREGAGAFYSNLYFNQ